MVAIAWIRRSMREHDNTALVEASKEHDKVIPFYVVDENYFEKADLGYPRVKFWHDALENFREDLQEDGKNLVVRKGDPFEELQKIVEETGAEKVYFNRDYSGYARERDEKVRGLDAEIESFKDLVMFEKDEILTNDGAPYQTFTYYAKKWFKKDKERPQEVEKYEVPEVESEEIPSLRDLGFERPQNFDWSWNPSREGAQEKFEEFKEKIMSYDKDRDYAWKDSTSKLSPHLKFGAVSVRELFWEAERIKARNPNEDTSGIKTWQEELAWRDFYFQMLYNFPESREKALQEQFRSIKWRSREEAKDDWKAFTDGKTGFPFVDAGMRQLKKTGWMHNRLRMVVTSFACKDLWLNWKDLHEYFSRNFVDAETASMIGGIQWAYSIGTDAQPYFRVFNPWKQGEKYDPSGKYIREWVPELRDVPNEYIHRPQEMSQIAQNESDCMIGEDYPWHIIDHDEERKKAVERFEDARE
ncbi:MAG: cryptochrome/photolyase family protein [Candidatus Nanohaloarchaea archaeon]